MHLRARDSREDVAVGGDAVESSASRQLGGAEESPQATPRDALAEGAAAVGARGGSVNLNIRKMRIFDDVTTSSSSSPREVKKSAGAEQEMHVGREALLAPQESGAVVEHKARSLPPTQPSSSSHDAAGVSAMPAGPPQVDICFNKPACDAPLALAEVTPTLEPNAASERRGSLLRGCDNAQAEDDVLSLRKAIKRRLEDFWEFGRETDSRVLAMLLSTAVALVLTVIGAPLSQVDVVDGGCYTYWGYKEDCDSLIYTNHTAFLVCDPVRRRLQVGAAFSMMTVFLLFVALVCCGLLLRHELPQLRLFTLLLLAIALVFQMISWAVVASIFGSRYCEDASLPRRTAYGVAFGLSLTSWLLVVVGGVAGVLLHFY
ncbi:putative amastin [Trypanosoma conorhini]|uniref:Putative amastin n=1 Tax=Trypanosoma conorhini TaxID=83891 RepID=A0A3R7NBL9_9TRYP|nr:putative amastin [Trypanosoma conorhini]RNF00120.1 putative amastin [Trypanosoma conorhini]